MNKLLIGFLLMASISSFATPPVVTNCLNPSELIIDGEVKMKFCDIPAAQGVLIGSGLGGPDETPVKPRNFKAFQMAQFEVTQLQFKTVTGNENWKENDKAKFYVQLGNDNPAVYVSYHDATSFARILNMIDKTATYRLPTEAEFEYATRAGAKSEYFWGDEMDENFAFFGGNTKDSGQFAHKVDSCPNSILNQKHPGYCANAFGLYHMIGNVAEWTTDAYEYKGYEKAPTDGNVAVKGDTESRRSIRGGAWDSSSSNFLRSAQRSVGMPRDRYSNLGFRIVRIAK